MDIYFWPSLELIATVKIAKKILYTLCLRVQEQDCLSAEYDITKEFSSETASTIKILLSTFKFPPFEVQQIFGIARSLHFEIQQWFRSHDFILYDDRKYLIQLFCWHSYGVIDRFNTARKLIQDENIFIKERFVLSCKYYLDDYVNLLWKNMTEPQRYSVSIEYKNIPSIQYPITRLLKHRSVESICMFYSNNIAKYLPENYLGLRYYFGILDTRETYECLSYGIKQNVIHPFDLYLCFSAMDINELDSIIEDVGTWSIFNIIQSFLSFPLQYVCIDVLNLFWRYISDYNFRNIWNYIIRERMEVEWYDIDYIKFMKYLWSKSPEGHRLNFLKDEIYDKLESILWPKAIKREKMP